MPNAFHAFTIAFKDLRLLSRDKLAMFFILLFPIGIGLLFGAISGSFSSGEVKMTLAVVDEDDSEMSRAFVGKLEQHASADVVASTRDEAMNNVRRGRLAGLIAIPPGFGERAGLFWEPQVPLQVGVDPSRSAEAGMLQGLVMQAMADITFSRMRDPQSMKPLIEDARQEIANAEDMSPAVRTVMVGLMQSLEGLMDSLHEVREVEDAEGDGDVDGEAGDEGPAFQLAEIEMIDVTQQPEPGSPAALIQKVRSPWDISFPQAMVWGFLACTAGFAGLVVREHEMGTYTRLSAAPMGRWQILAGKGLACFLAILGVITVMIALGFLLGMRPRRWDLLVLASICLSICFVGLMMLYSVLGKSEQSVTGTAWGINMLLAVFGGGMIPLAFMPKVMQRVSNFDPLKWGILALEGAIWRDFSLAEMLLPCAILLLVGGVGMVIGVQLINRRAA